MNSIKKSIVLITIIFGLYLTSCTETDQIVEVVPTDEPVIISATNTPFIEIEETISPTQEPTIVFVPTALIENIEYYFTDFTDINNWNIVFYSNLQVGICCWR